MKMLRINTGLIVALLCIAVASKARGQEARNLVDKPVDKISIDAKSMQSALLVLAEEVDVPIGLELEVDTPSVGDSEQIKISLQNSTVGEVLDSIVRAAPNYRWRVVDDVINVFPTAFRHEILDTNIQSFSFRNGSIYELRKALFRIPEVKRKMKESELKSITLAFSSSDFRKLEKDVVIDVRNTTLRTLLNSIVLRNPRNFWVISRIGESSQFLVINFSG